jgi:hypothetical protein
MIAFIAFKSFWGGVLLQQHLLQSALTPTGQLFVHVPILHKNWPHLPNYLSKADACEFVRKAAMLRSRGAILSAFCRTPLQIALYEG